MRRLAILFLFLAAGAAALIGRTGVFAQQQSDTSYLAQLISRALSSKNSIVTVGAVDGALSSNATIRDITIADLDGVWFRADQIRLVWRRAALLQRKLEVERLEIGAIEVLRKPREEKDSGEKPAGGDEPLLPELPLRVEIQRFALGQLTLAQPVLGSAAVLGAEGNANLGNPTEGLALAFNATRRDRPGRFEIGLNFVPATTALNVRMKFDEPQGGLAAQLAGLPGTPPVVLDLTGNGTLDKFASNLVFEAGPTIGARGGAVLNREGAGRALKLDMSARIEGLLPAPVAPIFAGATTLTGAVVFADGGGVSLSPVNLRSSTAELDISGRIDAAQVADLAIRARKLDGADQAGAAVKIGRLTLDTTIRGKLSAPHVDGRFELENAALPAGRAASVVATARVAPLARPEGDLGVTLNAAARGLEAADPAIRRALGQAVTLDMQASVDRSGLADIADLRLKGHAVEAVFRGKAGQKLLDGKLDLSAPDLALFSGVAGLKLAGALAGNVRLTGVPGEQRIEAAPDLKLTKFATGLPAIDGALGSEATLAGRLGTLPGGGYAFHDLKLEGEAAKLRIDGSADRSAAAIDFTAGLPRLDRLDERLTGRAALQGKITGTVEHPDLKAQIAVTDATVEGRPVGRLALDITGTDLIAAPQATAKLDGLVSGKPAKGQLALRREGDGWRLDGLDVAVGSVLLKGEAALAGGLAQGRFDIRSADLSDAAPLAMIDLAGNLEGRLDLTAEGGRQNAGFAGRGNRLRIGKTAAIDRFTADLKVLDIRDRLGVAGTLAVDQAEIAGESIRRIRLDAKPAAAGGDITLAANARGFDLSAIGRLEANGALQRLSLSKFDAARGGRRIALAQPGAIAFGGGRVELNTLAFRIDGGRIELDGQAAPRLDLAIRARSLPLAVAELFKPGLGLTGTLNAEANIKGESSAPSGVWKATIAGFSVPQTRGNGVPPLSIAADGQLAGGRTTLDATVKAPSIGDLRISGSAPIDGAGALDIAIKGKAGLALLNRQLGATGQRIDGSALIDLRIAGPVSAPQPSGGAVLQGVGFSDAESGFRLTGMGGRIVADGQRLRLENINGRTRNGGPLTVSGEVAINPDAGFPGRITIRATDAELAGSPQVTAIANVALDLSGPLARRPTIAGRIGFTRLDVTIPERLPGTSRPLQNVKHVNAPAQVKARLARKAKAKAPKRRGGGFDPVLDIQLDAPNRVFVRGRGLDAELAGQMKLTGTLSKVVPSGGFQMRTGRLLVAGKRLDFTLGKVVFAGDLSPTLDFLAQTRLSDATLKIGVNGPADAPGFVFSADPDMPQEEVLSRLVFGKPTGSLGPAQALQLAMVAAQFAGGDNDTFDRIRRQLGVDSLDVNLGSGGVGVGASRAINDRISIGVRAGTRPTDKAVSADVDITRNLRIQGEVNAKGGTSVGIGFEREY